ncbi:tetraacyldisaccharide 4'-kinase [Candidatus Pelagibacter sp.]|nr:tetraacyldisaccharide 4'-kinase [Candidatus Pelagibacter sp.]
MKIKKPRFWDYKNPTVLAFLLWPLSTIFNLASCINKKGKKKYTSIKTICFGNFYVGGTGKTSLSVKFKEILDKNNIKSCFIKKHYNDQLDEQKLLEKYGKVFVSKNRDQALQKAISENYEVAIFDDGLQDSSIDYDLTFVCFNNLNWIGNGFLIPAGPLRENINNLRFYKHVFLNGNNEDLTKIIEKIKDINKDINIYTSKYKIQNLDNFNKKEKYLVFSGIGNHRTFINMLKNNNFNIVKDIEFPDHYNYKDNDLDKIIFKSKELNANILTTEKDYLRLNETYIKNIHFIKSELVITDENKLIKILNNATKN